MAEWAVNNRHVSVRMACNAFGVSQTCYRYQPTRNDENVKVAEWLLRLTDNHKRWGFGLCFLYLRNVKGFVWNHKRVYRIYCELELNLRIKPKRRLVRTTGDRVTGSPMGRSISMGVLRSGRMGPTSTGRHALLKMRCSCTRLLR